MILKELLEEFAARLELGDFLLEDDGGAQIVLDDDRVVDVHANDGRPGFTFSSAVSTAPSEDREAALSELLAANLMGEATFGAALSLDPSADEIVLCRSVNLDDVPYEAFEAELAQFSAALLAWQDLKADGGVAADEDDPEAAPQDAGPEAGMMRV